MVGDDELTIDFGKVGDWFRRKKKAVQEKPSGEQAQTAKPEERSEPLTKPVNEPEDELSVDFSKIADWFRGKPEHHAAGSQDKDELGIDFGRIVGWVKAHPVLVVLLLVLIFQFVPNRLVVAGKDWYLPWGGMWMRLEAQDFPPANGWAKNHVYTTLKNQIAEAVNRQYPNLPDERKNRLVDEQWAKLYEQQKSQIEQQVASIAQQIRSFWQYEENGRSYLYMPDIDPYQWLRYARNYIDHGHVGDELRDGKPWDTHMVAPLGTVAVDEFHPRFIAWTYKIMKFFSPGIPLMQAGTYTPLILILLAMIPAFFIGRRFGGIVGGVIASTMIGIMPVILSRTAWGHSDTDGYNVLFPVLCTWLFLKILDEHDWKKIVGLSIALGFSFGVYAWAWPSWWYLFDFALAALGAIFAWHLLENRKKPGVLLEKTRPDLLRTIAIIISTGVFITVFVGFNAFLTAPLQPLGFTVIKAAAHQSFWPNVYTTVAELNPTNVVGAIAAVGGNLGGKPVFGVPFWSLLFFLLAVGGVVALLLRRTARGWTIEPRYGVFFAVWLFATLYASTKGVRFTLLLAPPIALCAGIALGRFYDFVVDFTARHFHVNQRMVQGALVLVFVFLLSMQARAAYATAQSDVPLVNDAWWNALTAIKQDSKPDAIINSWWDFGHHFKFISDRAVTFDGATQNSPMAHWIGRVLSTSNETEAVGILRMLDCGSNNAFDVVNAELNDTVKSVRLLYQVIVVDREKARRILEKNGVNDVDKVLRFTHCDPPENYFISSEDMIGKSGVWSHFGFWNFERAKTWLVLKNQDRDTAVKTMMNEWNYTEEQADSLYSEAQSLSGEDEANAWISPWLAVGGASDCSVNERNVVVCSNGVVHNLTSGETVVNLQQGIGIPPLVVIPEKNGSFVEIRPDGSNMNMAVLLFQTGASSYRNVIASPELIKSIFVRLHFLEGHGLRHFKEFNRQQLLTGGQVITYKLDWAGGEPKVFSGLMTAKPDENKTDDKDVAKEGDVVRVDYIGWLDNGRVFDSTITGWKNKNVSSNTSFEGMETTPLIFTIGSGQVVAGFDAAVRGMKVGEEQVVSIPPNAAYGTDPKKHKLGNKTLHFRIKLVGIER